MNDVEDADVRCPKCREPIAEGDAFCENCGTTLTAAPEQARAAAMAAAAELTPEPATPEGAADAQTSARTHFINPAGATDDEPAVVPARACSSCGGEVGPDGYCTVCGVKAPNGREHLVEQPSATVVGICDKGIVHVRNEDAMALAVADAWTALVVCDGVTTATDSDTAAQAASIAARNVLASAVDPSAGSPAERVTRWTALMKSAATAAGVAAAATAAAAGPTDNPPSCTFVAAVTDGELIVTGCVGDSRAYWLPDGGAAEQLSVDDSWATEQIAAGVAREVAEAGPRGHAITRWLGVDSPEVDASVATTTVTSPGWLLVCSDGLWNYASAAADLAALVASMPDQNPLPLGEALVAWANAQGGHDNITVTLARLGSGRAATEGDS
jgi:serine/threonine protein phosphatase PrpC